MFGFRISGIAIGNPKAYKVVAQGLNAPQHEILDPTGLNPETESLAVLHL